MAGPLDGILCNYWNDVYRGFVITRENAYSIKLSKKGKQLNCIFSTITSRQKSSQTKIMHKKSRPEGPTPQRWVGGGVLSLGGETGDIFYTFLYFPIFVRYWHGWPNVQSNTNLSLFVCLFPKEERTLTGKAGTDDPWRIPVTHKSLWGWGLEGNRQGY